MIVELRFGGESQGMTQARLSKIVASDFLGSIVYVTIFNDSYFARETPTAEGASVSSRILLGWIDYT